MLRIRLEGSVCWLLVKRQLEYTFVRCYVRWWLCGWWIVVREFEADGSWFAVLRGSEAGWLGLDRIWYDRLRLFGTLVWQDVQAVMNVLVGIAVVVGCGFFGYVGWRAASEARRGRYWFFFRFGEQSPEPRYWLIAQGVSIVLFAAVLGAAVLVSLVRELV